jgi:MYXO-CTERM domain-containing protein
MQRRLRWALFAACASFSASATAFAADKYVAADGGDDGGPGSLDQPYATIQKCVNEIADGDTCWVRAGTYRPTESIGIWGKAGQAGAPRRLAAYPGENPVIDGSDTVGANSNAPLLLGSSYWIVEGLEVANSGLAGIQGWGASHLIVRGNTVRGCRGAGIALFWNGARSAHTDNLIEDNRVEDCGLNNAQHAAHSWPAGIAVERTLRTTLRNNVVERVHGEGMLAYVSDEVTFIGNEVRDTYATCYYLDNTTKSTIERNFCLHSRNPTFFDPDPPNAIRPHNGVQIANETYEGPNPSADNVIRNNIVVGAMNGFYYGNYQSGGGLRRTLVANNVFADLFAAAVHIDEDTHESSEFVNNVFHQPAGAVLLHLAGTSAGLSGDHNLWFGGDVPEALAGEGDVTGDPEFEVAAAQSAAGYKLRPGSPAAGAGRDLASQVPDDFEGNARSTPYDLGAYALGASLGGAGGAPGSGVAGDTGGPGQTGAGGGSANPVTGEEASGCACRSAGPGAGRWQFALMLLGAGLGLLRRMRPREEGVTR